MYEYDDFYNEPSEFDMQVDEFKKSLVNAVKDEYKAEMERLRKENAELQEVKRNLDQIKDEYDQKKNELEYMKINLKSEVRRERLLELMGDFKAELFRPTWDYTSGQKCDKCDSARNIYFKSPSGKQMVEECTCKNNIKYYKPQSCICTSFEMRNYGFTAWYEPYRDTDGMRLESFGASDVPKFIYNGESYDTIPHDYYKVYFKTEEECQAYCDWLTTKEGQER